LRSLGDWERRVVSLLLSKELWKGIHADQRRHVCSLWLPRKEMYYPAMDQVHKFRGTKMYDDFHALYNVARQKDTLLERYRHEILADKARIDRLADTSRGPTRRGRNSTSNRGLFVTDDEDSDADKGDSHLEDSEEEDDDDDQPARKRTKTTDGLARTTRSSTIPARPLPDEADALATPPTSTASAPTLDEPEIKAEVGDDGFPVDLMDVHIGGHKFRISEVDIQQSKVLTSYILRKPGREPWIMDPDLADVSAGDFEAVRQFLQSGEFEPMYIHRAEDASIASGNGSLEGVETVQQDSEQIARLGRLYVLARRFGLVGMQGLVFKKIKAGFPAGWASRVMLGMVEQVWRDVPGTVDDTAAVAGTREKDALKEWLVGWLAFNVQFITEAGAETARLFWGVLNRTPGLRLAVSRVDATNVERYKGVLVDVEGFEDAVRRGRSQRR
jgi:hypothetical protein